MEAHKCLILLLNTTGTVKVLKVGARMSLAPQELLILSDGVNGVIRTNIAINTTIPVPVGAMSSVKEKTALISNKSKPAESIASGCSSRMAAMPSRRMATTTAPSVATRFTRWVGGCK